MAGSLVDPDAGKNTSIGAYQLVTGTGGENDGRRVAQVVLTDPGTGLTMVPGAVTFTTLAIADGSDVAEGAVADALVAAGAAGTVSAKLRRVTQGLEDLKTLLVLAAGTHIIGKVGIDQTTPGTTNAVALASLPGATSYAACGAGATTTAKASAGTLYGVLATGTGTAGTVALTDGATTYLTVSLPAAAGVYPLPLPTLGVAHGASIKVTTTGTGVTAAAFYI